MHNQGGRWEDRVTKHQECRYDSELNTMKQTSLDPASLILEGRGVGDMGEKPPWSFRPTDTAQLGLFLDQCYHSGTLKPPVLHPADRWWVERTVWGWFGSREHTLTPVLSLGPLSSIIFLRRSSPYVLPG